MGGGEEKVSFAAMRRRIRVRVIETGRPAGEEVITKIQTGDRKGQKPGDSRVNRKWGRARGFILKVEWIVVGSLNAVRERKLPRFLS